MAKKPALPRPTTVDFESFEIEDRPSYPPVPTSVSIKEWGKPVKYYSWGHATGNNCTHSEAREALTKAWTTPDGLLFHNAKFDLCVAQVHFGLPVPSWERIHDTLFLGFLDDPNQTALGLKPLAERLLELPSDERDALADWLTSHQPVPGVKITNSRNGKHVYGKYIPFAPGTSVTGPYANGDVLRTERLFKKLWRSVVVDRDMGGAYDRERKLLLVLMDIEAQGVRVDLPRLQADIKSYRSWLDKMDAWLTKSLGSSSVNLNSGEQLMAALVDAGLIDVNKVPRTPTGKLKSDDEALKLVTDPVISTLLIYRAKLKTCLVTFMENWASVAERSGGLIFTEWHQVRGADGGGTRTGRLSSTPNFQNISKEFPPFWRHEADRIEDPTERKAFLAWAPALPAALKGLPALPLVRGYVVPYFDGHVLLDRDYSQQEPRILAHFEGGNLMRQYQEDPWIDYHDNAKKHLERVTGRVYKRKPVKNINLGLIYGQGLGSLAERNGSTVDETRKIRDGILALYPGLSDMNKGMKRKAAAGEPLITWGGRRCLCEPPKIVKNRVMTFEYKMINTLVQGSAGDCTKEAMIRFYFQELDRRADLWRSLVQQGREYAFEHLKWRLLLSVHDELILSAPRDEMHQAMRALRECMESVEFDVLILSEGEYGDTWATLKTYDKKGKEVHGLH